MKKNIRMALILSLVISTGCDFSAQNPTDFTERNTEENYKLGEQALAKKKLGPAKAYFEFVAKQIKYFPLSEQVRLARLRLIEIEFKESGSSGELIPKLQGMLQDYKRLYPTAEEVRNGYCDFSMAELYLRDLPSDFVLRPPRELRGQIETKTAFCQLRNFVKRFPTSKYREKADQDLVMLTNLLMKNDLWVATDYRKEPADAGLNHLAKAWFNFREYKSYETQAKVLARAAELYGKMQKFIEQGQVTAYLRKVYPASIEGMKSKAMVVTSEQVPPLPEDFLRRAMPNYEAVKASAPLFYGAQSFMDQYCDGQQLELVPFIE